MGEGGGYPKSLRFPNFVGATERFHFFSFVF